MRITRTLRLAILHLARAAGLFALARRLTRGRLRILAYHGASLADEHEFRPGLFMTASTFQRRMRWLAARGYPVLTLDAAMDALHRNELPAGATVITIDDGWYGTYRVMAPALAAAGFPATLYLATYYLQTGTQVFNVAAAYLLWRARESTIDLDGVLPGGGAAVASASPQERAAVLGRLESYAESLPDAHARQEVLRRLCDAVGVDRSEFEGGRRFAFMSASEASELPRLGIDLQLHTHRHRFPAGEFAAAEREIEDNRRVVATLTSGSLRHFCYPSGRYTAGQLPWLARLRIDTAVTTEPGLNDASTPAGELRRILDSEAMTDVEFEAEMSGFRDLFRRRPGS